MISQWCPLTLVSQMLFFFGMLAGSFKPNAATLLVKETFLWAWAAGSAAMWMIGTAASVKFPKR